METRKRLYLYYKFSASKCFSTIFDDSYNLIYMHYYMPFAQVYMYVEKMQINENRTIQEDYDLQLIWLYFILGTLCLNAPNQLIRVQNERNM